MTDRIQIIAGWGAGRNFLSHLLLKDSKTKKVYYDSKFNEYIIPTDSTYQHQFVWNESRWIDACFNNNHTVSAVHNVDSDYAYDKIYHIRYRDIKTVRYCRLLSFYKRAIGTSISFNDHEGVEASLDRLDEWKRYIHELKLLYNGDILPTASATLDFFFKNKDTSICKLIQTLQHMGSSISSIREAKEELDIQNYQWKFKSKPLGAIPIYYEDLMLNIPTETVFDQYAYEIREYHQRNIDLIKKYDDIIFGKSCHLDLVPL